MESERGRKNLPPVQLDAFHPVIIRLTHGQAEIRDLVLSRPLPYWIDTADPTNIPFPISLAKDEYFLLGDNVPTPSTADPLAPFRWTKSKARSWK